MEGEEGKVMMQCFYMKTRLQYSRMLGKSDFKRHIPFIAPSKRGLKVTFSVINPSAVHALRSSSNESRPIRQEPLDEVCNILNSPQST